MNKPLSHIPAELLADFAEQRAPLTEDARVHLAICEQCATQLSWLVRAIDLMRTDAGLSAPAEQVQRAKQLFRLFRAKSQPARRRIAARLQFDSAQAPLAFGMRSGPSSQRQLLFDAEQYMIEVRVAPNGLLWLVAGQVLGSDPAGLVQLAGGDAAAQAELNSASEFSLPPAPAGQYHLLVALADCDIATPSFELP